MPGKKAWKLRIGRFSEPGRIYFVTACCFERKKVFSTSACARIVLDELSARCPNSSYESLAYVVMPDHVHWLVQLLSPVELGVVVGRAKGRSAYRVNRLLGSKKKVWQSGFHDHSLRSDEDVVKVGLYLIHNPVRAGLVRDVEDYPFWGSIWHGRDGS